MNKAKSVTRTRGTNMIRVNGQTKSIYEVRLTHRCRECLSGLKFHNSGLVCIANSAHRGFVHRSEAKKLEAKRASEQTAIEAAYEIADGQIVPRKELI